MEKLFMRKTSILMFILGLLTLVYISIGLIFFIQAKILFIITAVFLLVSLFFLYFFGVRKQNIITKIIHVIISFIVAVLCIIDSPINIAGIIFIVVNFIILDEYGYLKNKWIKLGTAVIYIIGLTISAFLNRSMYPEFFALLLLSTFFLCFIKMFVDYKQTEDAKKLQDSFVLVKELSADNKELLEIAKNQLTENQRRLRVLNEQSKKLNQYTDA